MAAPTGPSAPGGGPVPPAASGASPLGGTPVLLPEGWTTTVTERIVSTVDGVRAKTTTPIEKISRAVIWGLLIATAGVSALVLVVVALLHLLHEAVGRIPGIDERAGRSVWVVDLVLGLALLFLGLYLVRKGRPRPVDDD